MRFANLSKLEGLDAIAKGGAVVGVEAGQSLQHIFGLVLEPTLGIGPFRENERHEGM
jgi:hypothetical protein